jgi:Lysyl oxidase
VCRFTTSIANIGSADFRPFIPKSAWDWHACHQVYKPYQTKPNPTKLNQTKPNQTIPNQTKQNHTKPNQIKSIKSYAYENYLKKVLDDNRIHL